MDSSGNYVYEGDGGSGRIQVFVNDINIAPPIITAQPTDQIAMGGMNVTFSVSALGAGLPQTYQWCANNVAVASATNATFMLTNVNPSDINAYYSVLVTNSHGSALSSNAVLTVLPAIVITQPATGISATGAVLNGSVTHWPRRDAETWFEWGPDANYGNIAGTQPSCRATTEATISAPP